MNKKTRPMIEVTEQARATLKVYAAMRGLTMKEVVDEVADGLQEQIKRGEVLPRKDNAGDAP